MKNSKKGTLYLVLMILMALLLVLDIVNYAIPVASAPSFPNGGRPSGSSDGRPDLSGFDPFGGGFTMPEDGNFTKPENGNFTKPENGNFTRPENGNFTRPENGSFTPPEDGGFTPPEDGNFTKPENGNFTKPENGGFPGDRGDMPAMPGQTGGFAAVRSVLRRYWLPIAGVCLAGAVCFLVLFLRCRKKNAAPESDSQNDDEPPRRGKGGIGIAVLCLAAVGALILQLFPTPNTAGEQVTVRQSVQTGTADAGTIRTVLSGTGTLAEREAERVQVPAVVEISQYHVHNGDTVSEGTILASVKASSVTSAIIQLQSVLEELDGDLKTETAKSASSSLTAVTGGRVKTVWAAAGQSAGDVVAAKGALMVLSLDGLMELPVAAPNDAAVGDPVRVTLPEGTVEEGSVVSLWDGVAKIDFPDTVALPDETATVSDENGNVWGTGTVYIHSPWNLVGYYGNISGIPVSVNQKVEAGATLVSVTADSYSEKYDRLIALRGELEGQMERLFALYEDGYIRSTGSGLVSGVPADAEITELAANDDKITAKPLTAEEEAPQVVFLSNTVGNSRPPEGAPMEQEKHVGILAAVVEISGTRLKFRYHPAPLTVASYEEIPALAEQEMSAEGEMDFNSEIRLADGTAVTLDQVQPGDLLFFDSDGSVICAHLDGERPNVPVDPKPDDKPADQNPGGERPSGGFTGGGMPSGGSFSGGFGGGQTVTQTPAYETYSTEQTDVVTLLSGEQMTVQIQVDELDILSVTPGLEAQITLDAMSGRSFTGSVTKIARTGTNSGGNTKIAVDITLPRDAQMLAGMNASVTLVTSQTQAAVTVPVAALVEDDGKTYVYGGYEEKTDTLTDPVAVETGISDGETVEILSGLTAGSTYCYRYADGISYRFIVTS